MPLDVEKPGQLEAVFDRIRSEWGRLDFLINSIAFAPKEGLHGRVTDCSLEGFQKAMRISCYSFIEMARLAEPLLTRGGALLTMSYYGADRVVNHYNIMGPGESGAGGDDALYLGGTRRQRHPRLCRVTGAIEDASGERHRGIRRTRGGGRRSYSRTPPG